MAKTYILGNRSIDNLKDIILVGCNETMKNEPSLIHSFICSNLSKLTITDKIVIDLDSFDSYLGLLLALHIRLSVPELQYGSLVPIIFISDLPINVFVTYGEVSQIFLSTKGIYFESLSRLPLAIENAQPLSIDEYNSSFLDLIHISPNATVGHHSIANIWGADVFKRMVGYKDKQSLCSYSRRNELYYKYVFLKTNNISGILGESDKVRKLHQSRQINAVGKHILLIDDEADKGWSEALGFWFKGYATFDVVREPIADYDEIPAGIKNKIQNGFYDLYLVDLRLQGVKEENLLDPREFSGMKVLSQIKLKNKGNQVMIMTASNKAWNMKALFDAGADGYYIKESPEYHFPEEQSEENYKAFEQDVITAINSRYKRRLWTDVNEICNKISVFFDDEFAELKLQLKNTLKESVSQVIKARTEQDYSNAFLTLFQFFEIITREYIVPVNDYWIIDLASGECRLKKFKYFKPNLEKDKDIITPKGKENKNFSPSMKDKILNLYYYLGKEKKSSFYHDYIDPMIKRRNFFVHGDLTEESDPEIRKVFTSEGFLHEFETVQIMADILF